MSISQPSVNSQGQIPGTVSLTSAAPSPGITVGLASSNVDAARVPASVTVPAGATSASFTVTAATVSLASSTTITASYGGATRSASVSVLPPGLVASYTVSSPVKGADACVLGPDTDLTDCALDASGSNGFIDRYTWRYWTVDTKPLGHTTTDAKSAMRIDNRCIFFDGARGGDDAQGNRYIQMTMELVVQDRLGVRSAPVLRAVRLYPNRLCGFSY